MPLDSKRFVFVAHLVVFLAVWAPPASRAQWSSDPTANTPVAVEANAQQNSVAASDGAGGAIVAWVDGRGAGGFSNIFAQRLDAAGTPLWGANGVPVAAWPANQQNPAIIADGAGGAFIVWQDGRGGLGDIYAQHMLAGGVVDPSWLAGGIAVCLSAGTNDIWPMLVSDGVGGVIVAWEGDAGGATWWDIYAQRISGAGVPQWPPFLAGVPICTAGGGQWMPMLVEGGANGAIITWYDARNLVDTDIYAQRVDGTGAPQWVVNGIVISAPPPPAPPGPWPNDQAQPTIATDGAGGAIITWYDRRNETDWDIYAQHVLPAGVDILWPANGSPVCTLPQDQEYPKIVSDGAGGAIIAWTDRGGGGGNIGAQRVNAAGIPQWGWPALFVCTAPNVQELPKIVSDGAGGAIIAWTDYRSGLADIYAQRVAAGGALQWAPADGVPISTEPANQVWQVQFIPMVADGNGGAIVTWNDGRPAAPPAAPPDIYAQRVNADGSLGDGAVVRRVQEDPPLFARPEDIAAAPDGGAVVTGSIDGDLMLYRFRRTGDLDWARSFDLASQPGGGDEAYSIAGTATGGWATAGTTRDGASPASPLLASFSAGGNPEWAVRMNIVAYVSGSEMAGPGVTRASDGGLVVAGSTTSYGSGTSDIFLSKFNGSGAHQWTVRAGTPEHWESAYDVTRTWDGGYAVTGAEAGIPGAPQRLHVVRFDGSGALLWARALDSGANREEQGLSIVETADRGLAVAGYTRDLYTQDLEALAVKFDAGGNLLWTTWLAASARDFAARIVEGAGGALLVSGETNRFGGDRQTILYMLDASGNAQWTRQYATGGDGPAVVSASTAGFLAASESPAGMLLARFGVDGTICVSTSPATTVTHPTPSVVDPGLSASAVSPSLESVVLMARDHNPLSMRLCSGSTPRLPPSIPSVRPPCGPDAGQTTILQAEVTDPENDVSSVRAYYSVDWQNWSFVNAAPTGGNTYQATLPGQADQAQVAYYLEARDADGYVVQSPSGAPNTTLPWYRVGIQEIDMIQWAYMGDSCATSFYSGGSVNVAGVVTHRAREFSNDYFYIRRYPWAWAAMRVFVAAGQFVPEIGDSVRVSGTVEEFDCQTQVSIRADCAQTLGQGYNVRARRLARLSDIQREEYESVLVTVPGPICVLSGFVEADNGREFKVGIGADIAYVGDDTFTPDDVGYSLVPQAGMVLDSLTGIVAHRQTATSPPREHPEIILRLEPRRDPDVTGNPTAVLDDPDVPRVFALHQNVPNPFNPNTTIEFSIPEPAMARLHIYDASGRRVRQLLARKYAAPVREHVVWDGRGDRGHVVGSGVYFYELKAGSHTAKRKMLLVR